MTGNTMTDMVMKNLSKEWLLAQKTDTGNSTQGLTREDLQHVLSSLRKNNNHRTRNESTVTYEKLVDSILAFKREQLNWTFIVHGKGPKSSLDIKMREYFIADRISIPTDAEQQLNDGRSSPLTPDEDEKEEEVRPPTPEPCHRVTVWKGSSEDFLSENVLWQFMRFDPQNDVKLYDPKVIVINRLGDDTHEVTVKRRNASGRLNLRLFGVAATREDDPMADNEQGEQELDPAFIAVAVDTQEVALKAIFQDKELSNIIKQETREWELQWMPHPSTIVLPQRLGRCDPTQVRGPMDEPFKYEPEVAQDHFLPVIGAPNTMRVILVIRPRKSAPKEKSEAELEFDSLVGFLQTLCEKDTTIAQIRVYCTEPKTKGKGQSLKVWAQWFDGFIVVAGGIVHMPQDGTDRKGNGKLFNNHHWASIFNSTYYNNNKHNKELRAYFRASEKEVKGVNRLLDRMQKAVAGTEKSKGDNANASGSGSGSGSSSRKHQRKAAHSEDDD
ncbi:hypothetical protein R3P38DRAFT_2801914 [Favolaschia claudopus]|uniref:Uncharacterized protein n=1 Tax=Favolaschia claudopus TaxID=2862362 RepID=A0AAV9ZWJ9_9AGAR